jgi:hypothetical protein
MLKSFLNNNKFRVIVVVLLFIVSVGEMAWWATTRAKREDAEMNVRKIAVKVVEDCKAKGGYRPTCYENTVPLYLKDFSMEKVFEIVREVRREDPTYGFCHVLGHKIGEGEVAKNPADWASVVRRCPVDGLCSNGCGHGAIVHRFRADTFTRQRIDEEIIPAFKTICEKNGSFELAPMDKAMCYHGLGHVSLFIADADIASALHICRGISTRGEFGVCAGGVFMQIFQPLEPDDFDLVKKLKEPPTREGLMKFCRKYGEDKAGADACLTESWPLYKDEVKTGKGTELYCSIADDAESKDRCYESAIAIAARGSIGDSPRMYKYCADLLPERQALCYGFGSQAILDNDHTAFKDAIDFCEGIPEEKGKNDCYEHTARYTAQLFKDGDPQRIALCDALPPEIRSKGLCVSSR